MKKSVLGLSAVCCVAAVAFLGGCNKNSDTDGCGSCSDKATVKEGSEKPAAASTEKSCGAAQGSCCKSKAAKTAN